MIKTKVTRYEIANDEFLKLLGITGKVKYVAGGCEFVVVEVVEDEQ